MAHRVFIACSLDGFIAGPEDDLSWLPHPPEGEDYGYAAFMAEVGALLMGRNTYRVVEGFEGPWPYGETPVLVATHRPLEPKVSTVQAISGEIASLLKQADAAAAGKDVWVDGGDLIRQALAAGLLDELIVSVVPVVLGGGAPLFSGAERTQLELIEAKPLPGLLQTRYRPI